MHRRNSAAAQITQSPSLLRLACERPIVLAALKVALVVGTVLNLVNQGAALFAGEALNIPQLLMNYIVPYCVSSYSAAKNELRQRNRP
ncbi:hypothetical protein B4966_08590 [Rhodocyclaceae bacterium]|nr:hypothetical protein B4966_08590 [Rhodocyclaceae bacterium]